MRTIDMVVKQVDAVRLAETTGIAPGFGHANIGPVFDDRLPVVWARLAAAGIVPGLVTAYYDFPDDEGNVVVHLGFDIGVDELPDGGEVRVVELAAVEVASALHRGPLDDISDTFEAAVGWIDGNGYELSGQVRELTLSWDPDHPEQMLVELQFPVSR